MDAPRAAPSPGDVAMEVGNLSVGLGIILIPLFPFALPALVLVVAPLALAGVVIALVAAPIVLPLLLVRKVLRARPRRSRPAVPSGPSPAGRERVRAPHAGRAA